MSMSAGIMIRSTEICTDAYLGLIGKNMAKVFPSASVVPYKVIIFHVPLLCSYPSSVGTFGLWRRAVCFVCSPCKLLLACKSLHSVGFGAKN
jgi:hypothetical protein